MSLTSPALAGKLAGLQSSAIRDLLKLTARPEIISLAGGLPDAALMPGERIAAAAETALRDPAVLQYTESPGWPALRAVIAARASAEIGREVPVGEVFITHGSQQALSLLAETLLDPGALVVVEDPAYVGALQVFRAAGARIVAVPLDADGLRVDVLEELLAAGERPAVVHTVANFHNPGGVTLAPQRRRRLAELAEAHGFWVIEDDPYGALSFDEPAPAPVAAYSSQVIRLSSVSKILAPALRVGWLIAPERVCRAVELLKQGADLCGSALTHQITADLLTDTGWLDAHVATVRAAYGTRARALVTALRATFGDRIHCTDPTGGMFIWADFTDATNTSSLLPAALEAGVAYVPGSAFAVTDAYHASMRLCFTTSDEPTLTEAVHRLAKAAA
ncbi:aminotransferase-like domain-containing protein [Nocardia caishijiensis]|uniref:2-aminoadipate transaminase n=1 Tax=Nocardia caishijiensis TaxID=184756 RepID=A0ABQ6YRM3_9NOCA|nr:PLP-dependent aminotransferase family protein [Nocardia caishijiensis]KAF0848462.1 2-aminoadipate transaminase [Nocardia caishijiensis]